MAMDILACFENKPKDLDFIIPGFLKGTVGVMAAAGGVGKSFWALELAIGLASNEANRSLLNIDIKQHGRVVIFNAEDPQTVLHHRLYSIGTYLKKNEYEKITQKILIKSLTGKRPNIMNKRWQESVLRVSEGARLVIFDTFSRWHNADENSNNAMAEILSIFEMICDKTGAAILLLHHVNKSMAINGRENEQQATRGAAAITDNARWQGWMQIISDSDAKKYDIKKHDIKKYIHYGCNKENYGQATHESWFKRCDGGVLIPVELQASKKNSWISMPELLEIKNGAKAKKEQCNEL